MDVSEDYYSHMDMLLRLTRTQTFSQYSSFTNVSYDLTFMTKRQENNGYLC